MIIEKLTPELVREYRSEIARFYYDNLHECACLEHYTYDEAYEKIGDFIAHLEVGTCVGFGLFEDKQICGFIWAYPHQFREENRMYINEIRVKEIYRNKGYGVALLGMVEKIARETGIGAVYLHAEANNSSAINFYEASGFERERYQFRKEIT